MLWASPVLNASSKLQHTALTTTYDTILHPQYYTIERRRYNLITCRQYNTTPHRVDNTSYPTFLAMMMMIMMITGLKKLFWFAKEEVQCTWCIDQSLQNSNLTQISLFSIFSDRGTLCLCLCL